MTSGYIKVIPSPAFKAILQKLSLLNGAPDVVKQCSELSNEEIIHLTTRDVKWCHQKIKEQGMPHRIHQLLNESEIILPKHEPPPRNPELEARIQRLKFEQSNREYRNMTKNLIVDQYEAASLKGIGSEFRELNKQLREMNRQLVTGAQYLMSIVGTFYGIFFGLSFLIDEFGTRVLLGIFCAALVAVAEIYFIIRQDINEEEILRKKAM